ncbi:TMV resistance protein N-like protein [Tanacetum coccineum]
MASTSVSSNKRSTDPSVTSLCNQFAEMSITPEASTSSSSIQNSFKYDVFLSFRGEDTRKNFVDHLYQALKQKSIVTYKDDENIKQGKMISDELIEAIEDSKFYIIVFSKNYASSSWCLEELVKIMECRKGFGHTAYPVFYDVEPTEVCKQSGSVGIAFAKLEEEGTAVKWREALKEASDLAGWELKNTFDGHEAKFIQKIVEEISLELRFINSDVDGKLIGMETRVNDVVLSLETGVDDVRMIGIKGMGGIGKTTLARAVFDHISVQFEGQSFVENVSKTSLSGLKELQKQVLSDVLNDSNIRVSSVSDGKNMMKKFLHSRKVLVVLDDVDHIEQLEALTDERNWFKPGSRIIITTRDEQVLRSHRVNSIHGVNLLSNDEAILMFCRYAFGREIEIEGYQELSMQVVRYAAGLPLTIKVLGSFLCGKDEIEWKDAIERLKTIPLKETLEKLELSYNSLEGDYKEIFLDVACIFRGWEKDRAIRVLECCGFHARNGLRVLEQKSLITYNEDGRLGMHDHLQEMGRNIVRRSHPDEPERHSRLWIDKEIKDILTNDLGTQATQCLYLRSRCLSAEIAIKVSQYLPSSVRFMRWVGFPFLRLPNTFQGNHLVGLEIHNSKIVQLWKDGEEKVLNNLRFLTIIWSKLRIFDLMLAPNLESLTIGRCKDFVELHIPADHRLKLEYLHIFNSKLTNLHLGNTPNLKTLELKSCDLVEFQIPSESLRLEHLDLKLQMQCLKLKELNLSLSKLKTIHLGSTPNLEELILDGCNDLVELEMPAESLKLERLNLSHSKLKTIHLGSTPNLERLILDGCNDLVELEMPAESLKLERLNLRGSKLRTLDLGLTPNLKWLNLKNSYDLLESKAHIGCLRNLAFLDLSGCGSFKFFVFHKLSLRAEAGSLHLITEPTDVCSLHSNHDSPKFQFFCYYKEDKASSFGNLERLISLGLCACTNLESFSRTICTLQGIRKLKLEGSITEAPRDLDQLEYLEELIFSSTEIRNLPDSVCKLKHLKSLELKSCLLLEKLPDDLGRIESLETLIITHCNRLRDIPNNMGKIKCVISPRVYKRYARGKYKQRPINDAVDRPTGANT